MNHNSPLLERVRAKKGRPQRSGQRSRAVALLERTHWHAAAGPCHRFPPASLDPSPSTATSVRAGAVQNACRWYGGPRGLAPLCGGFASLDSAATPTNLADISIMWRSRLSKIINGGLRSQTGHPGKGLGG